MVLENDLVKVSSIKELVNRDFSISGVNNLLNKNDFDSLDEFREYLVKKLAYLLDNKFDLLIKTLYRIDINEQKLSELFSADNREFIPSVLADLIIDRQIRKINYRNMYKSGLI